MGNKHSGNREKRKPKPGSLAEWLDEKYPPNRDYTDKDNPVYETGLPKSNRENQPKIDEIVKKYQEIMFAEARLEAYPKLRRVI